MVESMPESQVKYMTDKIPMKRCGTIEEVAATCAFIVSEEASFNTVSLLCFSFRGLEIATHSSAILATSPPPPNRQLVSTW